MPRKKIFDRTFTMQTKITCLVLSLLLFVILSLTVIYSYIEYRQTEESTGQLALQVATTVSFMPSIREAFLDPNPAKTIQPIANKIKEEIGAEFVVVGNKDSIRYAHPNEQKLGKKMVGGDNDPALLNGEYYTSKAVGTLGPSLRGKAPIFNESGDIIGIVSVGFLLEDIKENVYDRILKTSRWSIALLLVGIIGSILLARNIRKDMLGLEPHEISFLFQERQAILESIHEGIIAIDQDGRITMINSSAKKLLRLSDRVLNRAITECIPGTRMMEVLDQGDSQLGQELNIHNMTLLVNRIPIHENNRVIGVVSSFRDKTEMENMLHTLSEVKKYSDELRAQTHEFTNRLHVISGLLQLNKIEEAIDLIQTEKQTYEIQNQVIFNQIQDSTFQAILLGKVSVASEKKIDFIISEESTLQEIPSHLSKSDLITVVGNIIDNAFDAVSTNSKTKEVQLFVTDIGEDIVVEISDNGSGINSQIRNLIFEKGFSTKNGDRGVGLAIVQDTIDQLNGFVEVKSEPETGTTFSVFIPKKRGDDV